jgi:4-hydroxybenzoate polyprenyltransferase
MHKLKAYLEIWRVTNLPTVWTNVIAACVLATGSVSAPIWILLLANSCFYIAGMTLNDWCDVDYDRKNRPMRPIPSGRISERTALNMTLMMFGIGLGLLFIGTPYFSGTLAGIALITTIIAYDLRHKQSSWSVLLMALCRALIFVNVSLALRNELAPFVLLLASLQFCYVIAISLVARYENSRVASEADSWVPGMLAGISLLDGAALALFISFHWLALGFAGALLTSFSQRYIRGD